MLCTLLIGNQINYTFGKINQKLSLQIHHSLSSGICNSRHYYFKSHSPSMLSQPSNESLENSQYRCLITAPKPSIKNKPRRKGVNGQLFPSPGQREKSLNNWSPRTRAPAAQKEFHPARQRTKTSALSSSLGNDRGTKSARWQTVVSYCSLGV